MIKVQLKIKILKYLINKKTNKNSVKTTSTY